MSQPGGGGAWGVTWGSRRSRVSSTEILTEGRHGVPVQSLKLGNTGRQETAESLVHRYSETGWPL